MAVITLTAENFEEEVLKSEQPVLVDFWAVWCGPCKMLSPVVDQIAEETQGVKFGKLNIDDEMDIAEKYGIMSIPTLMLFKNGEPVNQLVGVQPKSVIENLLK